MSNKGRMNSFMRRNRYTDDIVRGLGQQKIPHASPNIQEQKKPSVNTTVASKPNQGKATPKKAFDELFPDLK